MAIKLSDTYSGRTDPPSIDYPFGAFKNCSAPEVLDGTPLDKTWANDKEGFFQGLLAEAEITADGQPDKVGASQYLDAMKKVVKNESPKFATQSEFDAHAANDKAVSPLVMQPVISGSATLAGVNNNISLTGVVSSLGLEKGDVIRVVAGSYNKLHTVESLTDAGNIVVNYEHCGARGNGYLKLPDYSGSVTIKRIAKWVNASDGLGQERVDLTSFRALGVPHPNSSGRTVKTIVLDAQGSSTGGSALNMTVDGDIVSSTSDGGSENRSRNGTVSYDVKNGAQVSVTSARAVLKWWEIR